MTGLAVGLLSTFVLPAHPLGRHRTRFWRFLGEMGDVMALGMAALGSSIGIGAGRPSGRRGLGQGSPRRPEPELHLHHPRRHAHQPDAVRHDRDEQHARRVRRTSDVTVVEAGLAAGHRAGHRAGRNALGLDAGPDRRRRHPCAERRRGQGLGLHHHRHGHRRDRRHLHHGVHAGHDAVRLRPPFPGATTPRVSCPSRRLAVRSQAPVERGYLKACHTRNPPYATTSTAPSTRVMVSPRRMIGTSATAKAAITGRSNHSDCACTTNGWTCDTRPMIAQHVEDVRAQYVAHHDVSLATIGAYRRGRQLR